MLSERVTCRLVAALAERLCGWCSSECIREALSEGRGACLQPVRDAYLAVLAGYAWLEPPGLDASLGDVLEWSVNALYTASVAPLLASRRGYPHAASRGLQTRRVIERLLHDYWLVSGARILATDARLPGGWVTYPKLVEANGERCETRLEALGGLRARLVYSCKGFRREFLLEPPRDTPACKGYV